MQETNIDIDVADSTNPVIMDDEVDMESCVHYDSVQIKSEPNDLEMIANDMNTGAGPSEPDKKTTSGPGDNEFDVESCETARNIQNVGVDIKEESNIYYKLSPCSWNVTDSTEHTLISDYSSNNDSGTTNLHVHNRPSFILSNEAEFAVCIKYEPNLREDSDPSYQSKPCFQTKEYQDTLDNTQNKNNQNKPRFKTEDYQATPDNTQNKPCVKTEEYQDTPDNTQNKPCIKTEEYQDTPDNTQNKPCIKTEEYQDTPDNTQNKPCIKTEEYQDTPDNTQNKPCIKTEEYQDTPDNTQNKPCIKTEEYQDTPDNTQNKPCIKTEEYQDTPDNTQNKPCIKTEEYQDTPDNTQNKPCIKTEEYQDTPDNTQNNQCFDNRDDSHSYGVCGRASVDLLNYDTLNWDVQQNYSPINCEIPESNIQRKKQ